MVSLCTVRAKNSIKWSLMVRLGYQTPLLNTSGNRMTGSPMKAEGVGNARSGRAHAIGSLGSIEGLRLSASKDSARSEDHSGDSIFAL